MVKGKICFFKLCLAAMHFCNLTLDFHCVCLFLFHKFLPPFLKLLEKRKLFKFSLNCTYELSLAQKIYYHFRLGYAVYLLDRLLEENKDRNLNIHIIYDIACVLKLHLQVRFISILSDVSHIIICKCFLTR